MSECNFDKLVRYTEKKLSLDDKLELLQHLDWCDTCWEAIFQLSKDRDVKYFVHRPHRAEKVPA
jgi:hypothetical protein